MAKYSSGIFVPKNPSKYAGNRHPTYRSSWEYAFMSFADNNPSVLSWASESIKIPYRNPLTGKQSIYVPDFFVMYVDKNGKKHSELIEVKPLKETMLTEKSSKRDKLSIAINHAKWEMAAKWCRMKNIKFRVVNEGDIFHTGKKK